MDWEEWIAAHPPREVAEPPGHWRYKGPDVREAHQTADGIELLDEVAAEVVRHGGVYYAVYKD